MYEHVIMSNWKYQSKLATHHGKKLLPNRLVRNLGIGSNLGFLVKLHRHFGTVFVFPSDNTYINIISLPLCVSERDDSSE